MDELSNYVEVTEKLKSYEEVKKKLNQYLSMQKISYNPDLPSLAIIKKAIEEYYKDLYVINDHIKIMNTDRFFNKIGLSKKIDFADYDLYSDEDATQVTLYGKSGSDSKKHSITVRKKTNEDKCELISNTFESKYDILNANNFYLKNESAFYYILHLASKYKLNGPQIIIPDTTYEILKVSLTLNPNSKGDIVKIKIEPNERYVDNNPETQRAFKEFAIGNEDKMITCCLYYFNNLSPILKKIVNDYCLETEEYYSKTKKYL